MSQWHLTDVIAWQRVVIANWTSGQRITATRVLKSRSEGVEISAKVSERDLEMSSTASFWKSFLCFLCIKMNEWRKEGMNQTAPGILLTPSQISGTHQIKRKISNTAPSSLCCPKLSLSGITASPVSYSPKIKSSCVCGGISQVLLLSCYSVGRSVYFGHLRALGAAHQPQLENSLFNTEILLWSHVLCGCDDNFSCGSPLSLLLLSHIWHRACKLDSS